MSAERNEEARIAVLVFLVGRLLLSHSPIAIRRGVNREGANFTDDEIAAALEFLVDFGQAKEEREAFGLSRYYKATAQGVLHVEREGLL